MRAAIMNELTWGSAISLVFWAVSVGVFFHAVKYRGNDIWKAIKGSDNKMQKNEIAVLYWAWMFPISVFIIFLMAILNLPVEDNLIDLIKWVLGSLDLVLAVVIIKFNGKDTNISNGDSKEVP